jgi:hypothetical protein
MPKDATKNVDRYKVRGGQLNEFDFQQNQADFVEKQTTQATNLIPGTPPEEQAERLKPVVKKAPKRAKKQATKAAKTTNARKATKTTKAAKKITRGASAKKLAARKAAKK